MKIPPKAVLEKKLVDRQRICAIYESKDNSERFLTDDDCETVICQCDNTMEAAKACLKDCKIWLNRESSPFDYFQLQARKACRKFMEKSLIAEEYEVHIPRTWERLEIRGVNDILSITELVEIGLLTDKIGSSYLKVSPIPEADRKALYKKLPAVIASIKARVPEARFLFS